jgi:Ca-activated chloride channel family protein
MMKIFPILLLVMLGLRGGKSPAQPTSNEHIIFIFDASGSMWQKLGNSTKIQIAKSTMKEFADHIPLTAQVGLIAYGHTHPTSCEDIETLIPPKPFDKDNFISSIVGLDPKGKTPIAKSIEHALKLLKDIEGPIAVILVSDGLETCSGNACELVRQAKASGVKITMHVVGFGIEEDDPSSLECLAQAGGGLYFPANNAEELTVALTHTLEEMPSGNAFLSIETMLDGKWLDASVRIYKNEDKHEVAAGRTYEQAETNPRIFHLEPGVYTIEVLPVRIEGQEALRYTDILLTAHDTVIKKIEFEQGRVQVLVTRKGALSDATIQLFPKGSKRALASARSDHHSTHTPAMRRGPLGG